MSELSSQPLTDRSTAGSRRVLLVEDEILIRIVLAEELRSLGFIVSEAANADEALTIIRSGIPIDLVLTDVEMPGSITGHDLARLVRSERPHTKIVVASGHAIPAARSPVADAVFSKPVDYDTLIQTIHDLIGGYEPPAAAG